MERRSEVLHSLANTANILLSFDYPINIVLNEPVHLENANVKHINFEGCMTFQFHIMLAIAL